MKVSMKLTGILLLVFVFITGCNTNDPNDKQAEKDSTSEQNNEQEENNSNNQKKDVTNKDVVKEDKFPLPVLEDWEEEEVTFKQISDKIDLWRGKFIHEGDSEKYFETYQEALKEAGFEVEVTQDADGWKILEFEQVVDGVKQVGTASFSKGLALASVQYFK